MFGRGFVAKEMELSRSTARAKRSCCEKGYVTDAFASMMSEGEVRSADPIMHRGYYARFRGVDLAVRTFLKKFEGRGQVVVLGGGLDSMFWRLHATGDAPAGYFEVDSELVVAEKQRLIRSHPALLQAAGAAAGGGAAARGASPSTYRLVACDLRDVKAVDAALRREGLDDSLPTLVLCECVLAYLEPKRGDDLVDWARATFAASAGATRG